MEFTHTILKLTMNAIRLPGLFGLAFLILSGCSQDDSAKKSLLQTVTPPLEATTLYFNGVIQPIRSYPVIPPLDGVIEKKFFTPGTAVAKNQLLLSMASDKIEESFRGALMDYIKASRDYKMSELDFKNTKMLKKYGIVSNVEYLAIEAKNQEAHFALQQASYKLKALMSKMNIPFSFLQNINFDDKKTMDALLIKSSIGIKIYSPDAGVVLIAASLESRHVKANKPLLIIGDMAGIKIPIEISAIHQGKITLGKKALVTSDALPHIRLQGIITGKESQPLLNGLAVTYKAYVTVTHLTDKQKKSIRAGMPVHVAIPVADTRRNHQ